MVDGFDYGELGVDPTLDPELVRGAGPHLPGPLATILWQRNAQDGSGC